MREAKGPSRRTGRFLAAERKRLFAVSYIAQEGNGGAAARAAGYTGTDHALDATASRLLRDAEVRAIIRGKVNAVEDGMGATEIVGRLTAMARLADTQRTFSTF